MHLNLAIVFSADRAIIDIYMKINVYVWLVSFLITKILNVKNVIRNVKIALTNLHALNVLIVYSKDNYLMISAYAF